MSTTITSTHHSPTPKVFKYHASTPQEANTLNTKPSPHLALPTTRPENKMVNTALHLAAFDGNRTTATRLLDEGLDIDAVGTNGFTPLHVAAVNGRAGVVIVLLARGANIGARDIWGMTPLHQAAGEGKWKVLQILAVRGEAEIDASDLEGQTPLHSAVVADAHDVEGAVKCVEILLARGADKGAKDKSGYLPADLATGPNKEVIKALLQ